MLVAAGPGVPALQDYSKYVDYKQAQATSAQGDTIDTLKIVLHDPTASFTIDTEDDIVILDANDPFGWPTVNLVTNPSFEGTFPGGIASGWSLSPSTPPAGLTVQSTSNVKYGSTAQKFIFNNVANATTIFFLQQFQLPVDENGNVINTLPYTLSAWFNVNVALVGVTLSWRIKWWNSSFTTSLGAKSVTIPAGGGSWGVNTYARYAVSDIPPAGAQAVELSLRIDTTSATNSGTLLMDGVQFEYNTFAAAAAVPQFPVVNGVMSGTPAVGGIASGWGAYGYHGTMGAEAGLGTDRIAFASPAQIPLADPGAGVDTLRSGNPNFFTPNQSNIETDTSGFDPATGVTISRDTTTSWEGAASLKAVTSGSFNFQFVMANLPAGAFVAGQTYTFSVYAKGATGTEQVRIYCQANNNIAGNTSIGSVVTYALSTTWTRYTVTVTMPSSMSNGGVNFSVIGLRVDTGNTPPNQAITFWLDGLQVEKAATASPWSIGSVASWPNLFDTALGTDSIAPGIDTGFGPATLAALADSGVGADAFSLAPLSSLNNPESGTALDVLGLNILGSTAASSYALVTSPALHQTAQQIAINNPTIGGLYGIAQTMLPVVPTTAYTFTMRYQVTGTLSQGATPNLQVSLYDANYNLLATYNANGDPTKAVGVWKALSLSIGSGTGNSISSSAVWMSLAVGISTPSGSAVGTIVVGEVAVAASNNTAAALGVYPTPYCDSTQPGCHVDRGLTNLAYRQLRVYAGIIRAAEADHAQYGGSEADIEIDAQDYSVLLSEAPANLVIQPGNDTDAIAAAFQYAINQGHLVGIDYTTYVQHIGTISGYVFAWQTTRDVMNRLSNSLVAAWYVDYYKYLHFTPDLAVSAPYGLSHAPDNATTFAFSQFKHKKDSTQSITAPVIEGSTQLSAPQSQSFIGQATSLSGSPTATVSGVTAALSIGIASGVTALPVASGGTSFTAGMVIRVGLGTANAEDCTVAAGATATSVPITAATTKSHSTSDVVAQRTVAAGATNIPVVSGGTSFTAGTALVLGTGVSTAESLTSAGGVGLTATNIPLTAGTRNAHYATETLGKVVLAKGTTYSSIAVAALTGGTLAALTQLTVDNGATQQPLIVATQAANGSTSISCYTIGNKAAGTFVAADDFPAGAKVTTTGVQLNSGQPIVTVDSASVGGTGLVVGQASTNTYAQGYTGLVDPTTGLLAFQNPAANGAAINASWRFNTPVLVRVHASAAEASTGAIRRKIHQHQKIDEIKDQQAAIDRANAELSKRADGVPVGSLVITSPPWPAATPIRPGTAIAVTFPARKLNNTLFQVQKVTTIPWSNDGTVAGWQYQLDIGYYQPDFRAHMLRALRDLGWQDTNITPDTVLQDVVSAEEGWAMTDSASATNLSIGSWGGSSTWGGTYTWG